MIKSIVNSKVEHKENQFPKLMQCIDTPSLIVYMVSEGKGYVLSPDNEDDEVYQDWEINDYEEEWSMYRFKDFHGSITLEQD